MGAQELGADALTIEVGKVPTANSSRATLWVEPARLPVSQEFAMSVDALIDFVGAVALFAIVCVLALLVSP